MVLSRKLRPGSALGLWWVVHLWVYEAVIATGWPVGRDFPLEYRVGLVRSLGPGGALVAAIGLFAALFLLVEGWRLLERGTAMDPSGIANGSVWWAARVLWRARLFVALSLALPPLLFAFWEDSPALLAPVGATYLWAVFGLPLSVYRLEVVESEMGAGWWRPRWPGAGPATTAVGLGLIVWLLPWLPALALRHSELHLLWAAPLVLVVVLLGSTAIAAVLVYRLSPGRALERAPAAACWQNLGPILALNARFSLACLFVLAPVAAVWYFLWKIFPVHAHWQMGQGLELPATARLLATSANAVGHYAVWWWSLPSVLLTCLLEGRLVFLLGARERDG